MSADLASELETLRARTREYLSPAPTNALRSATLNENHRSLDERAFYPKHAKRTASSAYTRVRRLMVRTEDQGCRICDVRASSLLKPRANPYRATQMEVHHHVIEWAATNAIDADRFHLCVVAPRAEANPARYAKLSSAGTPLRDRGGLIVPRRFSRKEISEWIEHDRDNLWVLCDVHHRHRWFGVHAISAPVWQAQRYLKEQFAAAVRRNIRDRLT